MTIQVNRFIGKTIMVCIPAIFEDGKCRPYKLVGVDLQGLWLQSADFTRRLLPQDMEQHADELIVFVPYAQIAGVLAPVLGAAVVFPPLQSAAPAGESTGKAKKTSGDAGSGSKRAGGSHSK
jgi:hypothetical protein